MKKLFGPGAFYMLPASNGFVFAAQQGEYDNKAVVVYRKYDLESGEVNAVTRNVYLLTKFGNHFESLGFSPPEYIQSITAFSSDYALAIARPDGSGMCMDINGTVQWKGDLLYREEPAVSLTSEADGFWAVYPGSGALIRYLFTNLRQDLRIGGGQTPTFEQPESVWPSDNNLLVCSVGGHKIYDIDLKTFSMRDYCLFDEPVYQYMKIGFHEIVRLASGIYQI